ncbi:AAA family ATPase [Nocardia gipuzkoensis]
MLVSRAAEIERIERALDCVRAGRGAALILRGDPGVGKSALLEHAAVASADLLVLRATGVDAETGVPGAALQLLLAPARDRVSDLPPTQARALRQVFDLDGEMAAYRFEIGLAVMALLAELAAERPVLCVLDDVHWFDETSSAAIAFAARRLNSEPVALLAAARSGIATGIDPAGLPELAVRPLDEASAERLLARRDRLSAPARRSLLARAAGNPLALLELPADGEHGRSPSLGYRTLVGTYKDQIAALAEPARALLYAAAVDGTGDPAVLARAAEVLGETAASLAPAEQAGLLIVSPDSRIAFRHPLIRTAAHGAVGLERRLAIQSALAMVFAERGDTCRYAQHRAAAAAGPDEETAAALERAAAGGSPGASLASMLERAAELTPEPGRRGKRYAAAASAAMDAGLPDRAATLADRAEAEAREPSGLVAVAILRARLLDARDRSGEAHQLLLRTASAMHTDDPRAAGQLLVRAAWAAAHTSDLSLVKHTATEAFRLAVPNVDTIDSLTRLFIANAGLHAGGPGPDGGPFTVADEPHTALDVGWQHLMLGDLGGAHHTVLHVERVAREDGAAGLLAAALPLLARVSLLLGRVDEAAAAGAEGLRLAADTGLGRHATYLETVLALLAAMRGDEQECVGLTAGAIARGTPPSNVHAAGALSLLDLGLGRYEEAFGRLTALAETSNRTGMIASLPDLIEAGLRSGRARNRVPIDGAYTIYAEWADQVDRPWTRAIALRCAALLEGERDSAEKLFLQALDLHRDAGLPFEYARTQLLWGEWLRRRRRRGEARLALHGARETFERLTARPWAERARAELRVAGYTGRDVAASLALSQLLTAQELRVARWAARGLSNREIGAQLFVSPRTVGYHLHNVFPKLGVRTRAELAMIPGLIASE